MLPSHFTLNGKGISAIVAFGVVLSFGVPPVASAAECLNEKLRKESLVNPATHEPYSLQLPDCRAYELVSPPNTGGVPVPVGPGYSIPHEFLVTPNDSVFWQSQATPSATGALADGGYIDIFRSRRTAAGWTTADILPSSSPGNKLLLASSEDGSAVLLETPLVLSSEDFNNPLENAVGDRDLFVARENGVVQFVSHGEVPNRAVGEAAVATNPITNPELTAVGFETTQSLANPLRAGEATPGCYIWADAESRVARLTNPEGPEPEHERNCKYLAVAADGQPIIEDTSGDSATGLIFATDPAPNGGFPSEGGTQQLSGSTPGAARFDAMSPNDGTVYLTTPDELTSEAAGETVGNIFGIGIDELPTRCVSCGANGSANTATAEYVDQSGDGSHVYFTIAGALYQHDAAGTQEIAPASDALEHLIFSQNGSYVIAETSVALSPDDTDGTRDIYELSTGTAPRLITSGTSITETHPVAVADSGEQVLYESFPHESPGVVDEWVAGETGQVSPRGTLHSDEVLGAAGPELEDIFIASHEPLVAQDENGGTTAIYDARMDGGFPVPLQSANDTATPNPIARAPAPYGASLNLPSSSLPPLGTDTASPPMATAKAKLKAKTCRRGFVRRGRECVKRRQARRKN